ncbi:MAG: metal-dependent transcriptional regulator [Candidatus Omnitrophica bacterium]|nr:metal-dependent transcriptional regulator [Candidatus Omnitrophota bacterium]
MHIENVGEKLSSNMEDYLEAIALIEKDKGVARVKDISRLMKVKTPSVTSALNVLVDKGLVEHERYGYAELTKDGKRIAQDVLKRHKMLTKFLSSILKIDPQVAAGDACKMEHALSPETYKKLSTFVEFVETGSEVDRPLWLKGFDHYLKTGKRVQCKNKQALKKVKSRK